MPESCTDRPTSSHEHVFLLTKRPTYFYDADAVREATVGTEPGDLDGGPQRNRDGSNANAGRNFRKVKVPGQDAEVKAGRNLRDVWTIATEPFRDAHFATFPTRLADLCIRAGTSERGCCPACGAPWARVVERGAPDVEHQRACGGDAGGEYHGQSTKGHAAAGVQDASAVKARILAGMRQRSTVAWRPTCTCPPATPVPCTVLDPFGGSGTVGLVADRMQRHAVLIELNPGYAEMARRRIAGDGPLLANVV
jgi:hypothetical protein